jgi:hypothetical protein
MHDMLDGLHNINQVESNTMEQPGAERERERERKNEALLSDWLTKSQLPQQPQLAAAGKLATLLEQQQRH